MSKSYRVFIVVLALMVAFSVTASAQTFPNPGAGNTDVTVMNADTESANVLAEYYDQNGNLATTRSQVIASNGSAEFLAQDSGLGDGWVGSLILSSDRDTPAVATIKYAGGINPGDDGEAGIYNGISQAEASDTLYLPALYKTTSGRLFSRLSVQSTRAPGTGSTDVTITFTHRDGSQTAVVNATIPGGAQRTWDLSTMAQIPDDWDGSAVVTSGNGDDLAAVATTHWWGRSSAYNGLTSGNTEIVVPSQFRVQPSPGRWNLLSAVILQNITTQPANVTLRYIPRDPAKAELTINHQIPAMSAAGFNTRGGGSVSPATFEPLGNEWDGSVEITSDQPLVGVTNTIWLHVNTAGTYSVVGTGDTVTTAYLPAQYRVGGPGVADPWVVYSATIVQNTGTAATDVRLTYYRRDGSQALQLTRNIAPGAAMGFNTRGGGSVDPGVFTPLGTNFQGTVKVESLGGEPLAVVGNVVYKQPGEASGTYNGIRPSQ